MSFLAENARMLLQYEKIGRKQIRIMPKQDPRANLKANLFVKDIDKEVTPKDLHNHFNTIGRVVTAQIATDASGKSLGYGYVQFESTEDAKRALEQLQNSKLKEKEISVQEFVPREKRQHTSTNTNLFIQNLPQDRNKEEIEAILKVKRKLQQKIKYFIGEFWSIRKDSFSCFERRKSFRVFRRKK